MTRQASGFRVALGCSLVLAVALAGCDSDSAAGGGENTAAACQDRLDNDGDTYVDCSDQDCALFVFCVTPGLDVREPGRDATDGPDDPDAGRPPRDSEAADGCTPRCDARVCGADGCGGLCGTCGAGAACTADGRCVTATCGGGAETVTGRLVTDEGSITWSGATVALTHRRAADGCLVSATITLTAGEGCQLTLRGGGRYDGAGGLTFADVVLDVAECAGLGAVGAGSWRAAAGGYLGAATIELAGEPDLLAAETCLTLSLHVSLQGTLFRAGDGGALTVRAEDVTVSGTFPSLGDAVLPCPCRPRCETPDGCGGCCSDDCPAADLGVSQAQLDFGPRLVGRQSALPLQLLSRGGEAVEVTSIAFAAGSSPDFAVDTTRVSANEEPVSAANPLVILPNDLRTLEVWYTPAAANDVDELTGEPLPDRGTLVLRSNAAEDPIELPVSGWGVVPDGPVGVIVVEEGEEVIPQTVLHLDGAQSFGLSDIRRWQWRVDQPTGSQSVFVPSSTFPNPTFEANVAGRYRFYLDVWDEQDVKCSEPALYEVVVIPDEAIHIELLWTTPGDPDETDAGPFAGSDVDLHFIHPNAPTDPQAPDLDGDGLPDPYFDQPFDTYWFNPHPEWGAVGDDFDDDPGLDRDDTDGAGPENINLDVPENGQRYQVAVHYWNDHAYGHSFVTVRIYIYQQLVYEIADMRLINYDLWCVAFIDWPSGAVEPCVAPGGGGRVTPNYRHPMFF